MKKLENPITIDMTKWNYRYYIISLIIIFLGSVLVLLAFEKFLDFGGYSDAHGILYCFSIFWMLVFWLFVFHPDVNRWFLELNRINRGILILSNVQPIIWSLLFFPEYIYMTIIIYLWIGIFYTFLLRRTIDSFPLFIVYFLGVLSSILSTKNEFYQLFYAHVIFSCVHISPFRGFNREYINQLEKRGPVSE